VRRHETHVITRAPEPILVRNARAYSATTWMVLGLVEEDYFTPVNAGPTLTRQLLEEPACRVRSTAYHCELHHYNGTNITRFRWKIY
jgi:hypothetical protein